MKYKIITDMISMEIEAKTSDQAAIKFAASEGIRGIDSEGDLMDYFVTNGGWCNIVQM